MREILPGGMDPDAVYKILTGLIVPRPIAWVTSLSENGTVNLAPFSAFALVTHAPPMLMVTVGRRAGSRKDTGRNILARGEFVVNIPRLGDAHLVHASSADLAYGESEAEALGLSTVASSRIAPPRLADVPAAMECRLRQSLGWEDVDSVVLLADILAFHVRDDLLVNGKIDTVALDPLARIGGPNYAGLGQLIRIAPPPAKD